MVDSVRLGAFWLIEPIASGGLGEVWRGVHPVEKVPVAIKVITGEAARDERYRAIYRNEVRAMARLTHPGIAMVLDYGEIDEEAAKKSGGKLVKGSPYMVMEYASGGSLSQIRQVLPWRVAREILLFLLECLGARPCPRGHSPRSKTEQCGLLSRG